MIPPPHEFIRCMWSYSAFLIVYIPLSNEPLNITLPDEDLSPWATAHMSEVISGDPGSHRVGMEVIFSANLFY